MKSILKRFVKAFKWIYVVYNFFGSLLIKGLKVFISQDEKLILFVSFGGKKFDDSPKVIYDYMKFSKEFSDFKFIWAFEEPEKWRIHRKEKVKIDTFKYYITALKATYWITNSSIERGLTFKGKGTFYLNTWHGTPIKKMGSDILDTSKGFKKVKNSDIDIMLAQSEYETNIFSKVFEIPRENFLLCGLPRNDVLVKAELKDKVKAKEILGISSDKKVILYAPTFREYERDSTFNCIIAPPIDFEKWYNKLGNEYVVLFRAHYEIGEILGISNFNSFVINVTDYPSLNELMIASDLLISDYSSIFFDYSILERPMICFAYDLDKYNQVRGMYLDLNIEMPSGVILEEEELIKKIVNLSYESECKLTREFKEKFIQFSGNATGIASNSIIKHRKGILKDK